MPIGTVKWFDDQKRFGYIAPDDSGLDIYVGDAALRAAGLDTLSVGQRLRYETTPNIGGRPAVAFISTDVSDQ
jgi:CspA family cold shock protein